MKNRSIALTGSLFAAVLCFASAHSAIAAEDTYVLAKKNDVPPVGTVLTKDFSMGMKDGKVKISAGGQQIDGTMNRGETKKETAEVLSATKIKTTLLEQKIEGAMIVNGEEQDTSEPEDALLKTPVIMELKAGKWSATLESGAEPTAEQKTSLEKAAKEANTDTNFEMYGDTPRKVGDEWKVDPAKTGFADEADVKGDYTVKFVEVKEVDGVKCAVLKATYDFKGGLKAGDGEFSGTISLKGEAVSTRSIADMTDLEVKITATMTMEGSPAEGVTMRVVGPTLGSQKIAIKKP